MIDNTRNWLILMLRSYEDCTRNLRCRRKPHIASHINTSLPYTPYYNPALVDAVAIHHETGERALVEAKEASGAQLQRGGRFKYPWP